MTLFFLLISDPKSCSEMYYLLIFKIERHSQKKGIVPKASITFFRTDLQLLYDLASVLLCSPVFINDVHMMICCQVIKEVLKMHSVSFFVMAAVQSAEPATVSSTGAACVPCYLCCCELTTKKKIWRESSCHCLYLLFPPWNIQ